jgi:Zn-dependent oligopeptidase
MQTPAHHAAQALLATQVETWLQTMVGKHEALYQQLREAEQTSERERVFQEVLRLLYEAIEEVRVLGAQLWEQRTAL